jgi:hypothetical protein
MEQAQCGQLRLGLGKDTSDGGNEDDGNRRLRPSQCTALGSAPSP